MRQLVVIFAVHVIGCGSPRASEPVAGPLPALDALAERGEFVFMRTCNSCHPQGEGGVGGALNNKPLPGTVVKAKVRGLVPGDMPKFNEKELSDDDVDALTAYLKTLRRNR